MTYRILRYTTSCLMAALLAASCTKVVEEVRTVPEIPISWQAVQTKAVVPYPVGSSFVSYAWFRLPEGEEWEEGGNDPELYIDKAVISHHDDGWYAGSDFIWPPEGTLSFYSYAPADMPGITVSADGISLINTLLGMRIDLKTKKPVIANTMGGFSGPGIFPVALRMVYQVYEAVSIPVIGMGGVSSAEDVIEMMLAGATAVEVGAANLVDPYACRDIIADLPRAMERYGIRKLSDIIGKAH